MLLPRIAFTVAISLGVVATSALATEAVPPALLSCASVKKNSERLACYDRTIERMSTDSGTAAVPERSAEAMFGAQATAGRSSAPVVEREELSSVSARVTALRHDASGALVIELDSGQQWRQTSGSGAPLLEVGHEVTITRAALNSFRMSTPSGRALKVKRVQ